MHLTLVRTGGVAGPATNRTTEIITDTLPEAVRYHIETLINSLEETVRLGQGSSDPGRCYFSYKLTIKEDQPKQDQVQNRSYKFRDNEHRELVQLIEDNG